MEGDLGLCRVPYRVMSPVIFLPWVVFNKQGKGDGVVVNMLVMKRKVHQD